MKTLVTTNRLSKYIAYILGTIVLCLAATCFAEQPTPLPVDSAFKLSATVKDQNTVQLNWKMAPGYYLYKDRFSYKITHPSKASLGEILLPEGIQKQDEILGEYSIFLNNLTVDVPVESAKGQEITLKVCYQGCSKQGFCYPPETKKLTLDLSQINSQPTQVVSVNGSKTPGRISEQDRVASLLANGSLWIALISFFGFGLLLAFTPCVLPMIPILSGIILGHEGISTRKAFWLSLIYVLAMSFTYALAGVLAGFAGQSIQAALQLPWVIATFSLLFVLLALPLFNLYELRLPNSWQLKLSNLSNRQQSGKYFGVAIMGVLSTLIVSPCVTAPLVGALAYIGNTGDSVLGGAALFVMGLGMGVPLLIIGTSGGRLLPKAGPWMDNVKAFFGVLLLAVAIWMLSRIIPGQYTMLLWSALLIISAVYMGILTPNNQTGWAKFYKGVGLLLAVYGILLMIGAAMGNDDPTQPLNRTSINVAVASNQNAVTPEHKVTVIKSNDDFDEELTAASKRGQIMVLDFYADWCIACKDMQRHTFTDPQVRSLLADLHFVQANVTNNDVIDQALQERLGVVAPPTIIFFDSEGNEIASHRIVGEMGAQAFIDHLNSLPKR